MFLPLPAAVAAVVVVLAMPVAATAQSREPLQGLVVDVRLATVALPTTAGWTPTALPNGAVVPGRSFGLDGGATVFVGPGRHRRLGLGVGTVVAQGRATGLDPAPTVTSRVMAVAPHGSMNFGHRLGWSYLSLGVGAAHVTSEVAGVTEAPSKWSTALHYGGGARWFVTRHIAVSLDLRFWALMPRPASDDRPSAPATTRVAFSAGLGFR